MNLVATYYDFVKNLRPHVAKYAALDAKMIKERNSLCETIHSVDDYEGSHYGQCFEETEDIVFGKVANETGLPLAMVKSEIRNFPDAVKGQLMSLFSTVNYEYHNLVNFELSGKKTFYFNDNLADHLANTDINMKADDIELPFASSQFIYTSESVINAMHNIRGADGRKYINTGQLDYKAPVSVFVTLHNSSNPNLPGRKLVITAFHAKCPNKSYQMLKRELYLGDGWTLEDALRTDWEKLTPNEVFGGLNINLDSQSESVNEAVSDEIFFKDGLHFYRIILNSILYLDSDNAEQSPESSDRTEREEKAKQILSAPKRRKKLNELSNTSYLDFVDVGRSVGPITIDKSKNYNAGNLELNSDKKKTLGRFIVRGHWKQQAYGPKLSLRKRLRIAPYYRGEEMADLINKPYIVK